MHFLISLVVKYFLIEGYVHSHLDTFHQISFGCYLKWWCMKQKKYHKTFSLNSSITFKQKSRIVQHRKINFCLVICFYSLQFPSISPPKLQLKIANEVNMWPLYYWSIIQHLPPIVTVKKYISHHNYIFLQIQHETLNIIWASDYYDLIITARYLRIHRLWKPGEASKMEVFINDNFPLS